MHGQNILNYNVIKSEINGNKRLFHNAQFGISNPTKMVMILSNKKVLYLLWHI